MRDGGRTSVVEYLRHLAQSQPGAAAEDELLLERFARHGDESAFTVLLQRHGPLVWGLCRRLLRHAPDAEDAFQATFLVLARRAGAIRNGASLRSWLYGVSYRIASRIRGTLKTRQRVERPGPELEGAAAPPEGGIDDDTVRRLHAEIERLPHRYRLPVILHYLEGKSREETAAQLGWTEGMVKGRLERARARLRARLASSAGLALALLAAPPAVAAAPPALLHATARLAKLAVTDRVALLALLTTRVQALVEGMLLTMWLAKLKVLGGVILVFGVLATGASLVGLRLTPAATADVLQEAAPAPPRPRDVQVPSRYDGFIQFIGTEIQPDENVPPNRQLVAKVAGQEKRFKILSVGDRVVAGQLVAYIDDRVAYDDYLIKKASLDVAIADRDAAEATYKEAQQQFVIAQQLHTRDIKAMSAEQLRTAAMAATKYLNEYKSKLAAIELAKAEERKAKTILDLYRVRSAVDGVITAIHKERGEGVKSMEAILEVRPDRK